MHKKVYLISSFLFVINFCVGQTIYQVFKTDGTKIEAKSYFTVKNLIRVTKISGDLIKIPYNQFDRIEYEVKSRKSTRKVTEEFVQFSKRHGKMMELIHDGRCKSYTWVGAVGGGNTGTEYYAKMEGDSEAVQIGSKNFIDLNSYKNKALKLFNDCPIVIEKINKKFKRKKVHDLVQFYNENCQ